MKEIYILVTDWANDSGENDSEIRAYSTLEKAKADYDLEVKTEKFTDPMCEGCFDGKGKFIEDNDEGVCCDELEGNDFSHFTVYREGYYSADHFTVYYKKINLDA